MDNPNGLMSVAITRFRDAIATIVTSNAPQPKPPKRRRDLPDGAAASTGQS